jgi:PAS domain S-box-containing protein
MEVRLSFYRLGGEPYSLVILRDITQRRRVEERLRASQERFHAAFHAAPLLASLSRLEDGHILEVNEHYCEVLGYRREEVLGRRSLDLGLFVPEDRFRLAAELQATGIVRNLEMTVYARGGRPVPVLFSGEVVTVGEEVLLVAMVLDISERKAVESLQRQLEAELQQSQKLESLGSLAGGIAHDMNNVLAAIQAVTQTLQMSYAADDRLVQSLATIEKASTRGRDLVKGLTNFARKDLREPEPLDLNALVRDEMDLLRRTTLQKVDLVLDLEDRLPWVVGERGILGSALMNLCVNALDAMPKGGSLTLRTRSLGGQVELAVADSGAGMDPAVLARAMEPFFTTKPVGKGTGLGLAMVYATVKAHGGTVTLQSEPGKGTQVRLCLPAAAGAAKARPEAGTAAPSGVKAVLVVDDDELIRASVPALVAGSGHRVTTAAGGREALDLLEAGLEVDLVILDLNMPGMSGAETFVQLRRLRPALPVLVATGHLDPEAAELLRRDKLALSIAKPFSLAELDRKMTSLFSRSC